MEYAFSSKQSLLDADIIIFSPNISEYLEQYMYSQYQGKPCLYETNSFNFKEACSHWRSELKAAVECGKTIIIYLSEFHNIFTQTGNREFSGTGRNQRITNIVAKSNNYEAIPFNLGEIIPTKGTEIKINKDLKFLAEYWLEFGPLSAYEICLKGENKNPMLTTKAGDRIVGAIIQTARGAIILLPPLNINNEEFTIEKADGVYWNKKGMAFGTKLARIFIGIDKAVHDERAITQPPDWVKQETYRFIKERKLEHEINALSTKIDYLQDQRIKYCQQLEFEGNLRRLLYEKGKQLEEAILEALTIMGFKANNIRENDSEFDAIFISNEGRFLGEAEGKDNNAINIDKLSQLERNIQEDFVKDEVEVHAKGVLFGNAFRLKPISERGEFFTAKCISGAKRSEIALVRTPDLFLVAQYLKENRNENYAKKCRQLLSRTKGEVVQFPPVPKK